MSERNKKKKRISKAKLSKVIPRLVKRPKLFFRDFAKPIYIVAIFLFTFGMSTVGRAATKIRRGIRTKKNSLKASYQAIVSAKSWTYFKPMWQPEKMEKLPKSIVAENDLLGDPQSRIDSNFHVPSDLKDRVGFWVDVYSRFSSQYRIIHDRDNPGMVFGYIDFRTIYRNYPTRMADGKAYKVEQSILKDLKLRISEAMELTPVDSEVRLLTDVEKEDICKMLSDHGIKSKEEAQAMLGRIRTQTGQRDHFLQALHRSKKLLPQIEEIFKERGLPVALARLPFVESSFHRGALSKTGASGIWQFMPDTSRLFDPSGTPKEWAEPLRQTKSAARMFRVLDKKFDNWGIALTAYNSGAARLQRMKDKYNANNIAKLIELPGSRETLGFAGKNFFSEFLAANIVEAYKEQLFTERDQKLASLGLSRRVQSILETIAPQTAQETNGAPVKAAEKTAKVTTKAKSVRHVRAAKKIGHRRATPLRTRAQNNNKSRRYAVR